MSLLVLLGATSPVPTAVARAQGAPGSPPPTQRVDFVETVHGVQIPDPYRWLEEENSPQTRAWIEAQTRFARTTLDALPSLPRVEKRTRELFDVDHVGAPTVVGSQLFYVKRPKGAERPAIYVRQGLYGAERLLLDPAEISKDLSVTVELRGVQGSGRYLVYNVRQGGEDEHEVRIRDLRTGKDLPDRLPRAFNGSLAFNDDLTGFYYSRSDKQDGGRVYFHRLGADPGTDELVFGEGTGPMQRVGASEIAGGRYLLGTVGHGWRRTDVYLKERGAGGTWRPLIKDLDALFTVYPRGDKLWVLTDHGAPNYRLVEVDPARPEPENWKDVLPETEDVLLGISFAGGKLFARYVHDAATRISIHEPDGTYIRDIELPGPGNASLPRDAGNGQVLFEFESFTLPPHIFVYDLATTERRVWHRAEPPIDTRDFVVKQEWFESPDGTRVPMYIVHKRGVRLDGQNPTLLVGYGGFNAVRLPSFMSGDAFWLQQDGALWVEQGGVYAVANLRGGNEFGRRWHRGGMLGFKQNVFNDFIAAAEHLVQRGYTRPAKLGIQGASNGGLLVGAALTQRPDLFGAVLVDLADLDMIGQPRFPKNNPPALLEYGDSRDPQQFQFLIRHSPYQNVRRGTAYPAVLLTGGDMDSRVEPAQTRKMAAALQWATSSDRPVLMDYHPRVGHGGWWGRGLSATERAKLIARQIAFLNWQLGVPEPRADVTAGAR